MRWNEMKSPGRGSPETKESVHQLVMQHGAVPIVEMLQVTWMILDDPMSHSWRKWWKRWGKKHGEWESSSTSTNSWKTIFDFLEICSHPSKWPDFFKSLGWLQWVNLKSGSLDGEETIENEERSGLISPIDVIRWIIIITQSHKRSAEESDILRYKTSKISIATVSENGIYPQLCCHWIIYIIEFKVWAAVFSDKPINESIGWNCSDTLI